MDMVIGMRTMMMMTRIMMIMMMMMAMTMTKRMMIMVMMMIVTRMMMEMIRCKAWQERGVEQVQGQHLVPSQSYTGHHRHRHRHHHTIFFGEIQRQAKYNIHLYCQSQ